MLLSIGAFLWWGITITKIAYSGDSEENELVFEKVQQCVGDLKGNTFFTINEKVLLDQITTCDPRIITASIQKTFPQKIIITYIVIHPIISFYSTDKTTCTLVESYAVMRSVASDICDLYQIPAIEGKVSADNKFMLSYAAQIVALLNKYDIKTSKIVAQGDTTITYYEVQTDTKKKLLLPDGANIEQKVAIIEASIKGLEEAKEGYSVIDVRFDRVVYR